MNNVISSASLLNLNNEEQSKYNVSVIVCSFNRASRLLDTMRSLEKLIVPQNINFEILVVDNNSTDDSIVFLKEHYPQVRIIQNEINGGFAKGYNDA